MTFSLGKIVANSHTQLTEKAYHLHVSVIILNEGEIPTSESGNGIIRNGNYFSIWTNKTDRLKNPFNNSEIVWKGRL